MPARRCSGLGVGVFFHIILILYHILRYLLNIFRTLMINLEEPNLDIYSPQQGYGNDILLKAER